MAFSGFLFTFSIVIFIITVRPLLVGKKAYDERQVTITNKSYRYSMLTVWALCLFFSLFNRALNFPTYAIIQTIFFVSGAIHLSYRILHHSLTPLGKSLTALILSTLFVIMTMTIHVLTSMNEYIRLKQPIYFHDWFSISIFLLSFFSILASLLYRQHQDRLEDRA